MYRRVFDFTVSNVSYVSNPYFSRVCTWHVMWHGNVSRVQNQAMYTLWWINREIRGAGNEHKKCSFCMECSTNQVHAYMEFSSLCDRICVHHDFHMCDMCDVCNISHDFVTVISIRRRVFDFTVSNVSNVSMLYFSRVKRRHVTRHVSVSSVEIRPMYTLWWMNRNIGHVGSEHSKCSFFTVFFDFLSGLCLDVCFMFCLYMCDCSRCLCASHMCFEWIEVWVGTFHAFLTLFLDT